MTSPTKDTESVTHSKHLDTNVNNEKHSCETQALELLQRVYDMSDQSKHYPFAYMHGLIRTEIEAFLNEVQSRKSTGTKLKD